MFQPPPPCSASNLQQRSAEPSNNKQIGNRLFYNDTKDQALHHFALLMEGTWRHPADQQKQGKLGKLGKQDTCDPKTSRDVSPSYRSYRISQTLMCPGSCWLLVPMPWLAQHPEPLPCPWQREIKTRPCYVTRRKRGQLQLKLCSVLLTDIYIIYDYRWHLVSKDIYLGYSAEIHILWFTWFTISVKEHPAEPFWRAKVEEPGRIH